MTSGHSCPGHQWIFLLSKLHCNPFEMNGSSRCRGVSSGHKRGVNSEKTMSGQEPFLVYLANFYKTLETIYCFPQTPARPRQSLPVSHSTH